VADERLDVFCQEMGIELEQYPDTQLSPCNAEPHMMGDTVQLHGTTSIPTIAELVKASISADAYDQLMLLNEHINGHGQAFNLVHVLILGTHASFLLCTWVNMHYDVNYPAFMMNGAYDYIGMAGYQSGTSIYLDNDCDPAKIREIKLQHEQRFEQIRVLIHMPLPTWVMLEIEKAYDDKIRYNLGVAALSGG